MSRKKTNWLRALNFGCAIAMFVALVIGAIAGLHVVGLLVVGALYIGNVWATVMP